MGFKSVFKGLKKNKIGHLKIKNYKFERVENIKYLGVTLNGDNNNQTDLQERIKNASKTYFMLQTFFKNKNISKKLQVAYACECGNEPSGSVKCGEFLD